MERKHVFISGEVQGVGYRAEVKRLALGLNIFGCVKNLEDGRVEIVAEGELGNIINFLNKINIRKYPIFVERIKTDVETYKGEYKSFKIKRNKDISKELLEEVSTYKLLYPKIIIVILILLGFSLNLLGFELSKEAYKDVFGALITLFASIVAFIGIFLIFRLENLNNRRRYAFEHLRNVVTVIGNLVQENNLGDAYPFSLIKYEDADSITPENLLTDVDLKLKENDIITGTRRITLLHAKFTVDLKVASQDIHKIDGLIKNVQSSIIKESFRNMLLIIGISIIFLPLGNINISSNYFQWFADIIWKPWLKSIFLMVIIGFSIITLTQVYEAIKSLLRND